MADGSTHPGTGGGTGAEEDRLLASLVQSVTDYAIFVLDVDGHIRTWNSGAERLKGYRREEIVGQHFSVFYPKQDLELGKPDWELAVAAAEGAFEDEGWRIRKDGTRFWANVVITAIRDGNGHLAGFGKVTRDLTERKRGESALRGILDREREAANHLRELDRLKTDFIAVVAHDLRGPVGVAQSLLQIGVDDWDTMTDAELRELVERARQRLVTLGGFVDDLFDAVRLDTGDLQISAEAVDVRAVVDQVVADARVTEPARQIDVDGPAEVTALADPQRTWQILSNLVSNAIKFSPPDTAVQVRLRGGDGSVAVEVIDRGPGVPAEQRELLFGRFARLPSSATTPGAGLGLFIARSLAEVQGGGLELADPSSEGGAALTLTLPDAGRA